jgi:hypothetical protein
VTTVLGVLFLVFVIGLVMTPIVLLYLAEIRLLAPRGYHPRRGRRRRAENIEGAIARLDEVETKSSRNVFFWPW